MGFLARWARHLSWRQKARAFQTSWEAVYRSVEWFVQWGLAHRNLEGIEAIGIDEIHWGKGKRADTFLTVIYQIDSHCQRLLWVGRRRTQATLQRGLAALGPAVVSGLRYACSDMWRAYLNIVAAKAPQALHVLDRFQITMHLNQAVDQVRRAETGRLRGRPLAKKLKHMRWKLLRRGCRVRGLSTRGVCLHERLPSAATRRVQPLQLQEVEPSVDWRVSYWTLRLESEAKLQTWVIFFVHGGGSSVFLTLIACVFPLGERSRSSEDLRQGKANCSTSWVTQKGCA